MARIYDNIELKFQEGLKGIVSNVGVKRADFCVGYFNLRGWKMVVNQVDNLPGDTVWEGEESNPKEVMRKCRLLIGMHRPPEELIHSLYSGDEELPSAEMVLRCKMQIAADFRKQLIIGLPASEDEQTLRHLSRQMKEGKVCVKLYLREPLHAKLYLAYRPDDFSNKIQAILGSSNLTYAGLTKQGELNADFADSDHVEKLARWFDDRWNDRFCEDITKELIEVIDNSWASERIIPPYQIYLKVAYHLSEDARNGIKEFTLTPEFRRELFEFQQNAVKIAARHLNNEKRGGAMIGDVVGLGKTITACAVAKVYEMNYACSTLIICPANLQDMWKKYVDKYDLKAEVRSKDKPINVENARYYRLVIIDESHNLRNSSGVRYQNIKKLIEHQDCKVLLLTATPYNKDFRDLSSQLRLFIGEDQDLGIRPEEYIRSIGGERQFMQKHNEVFIRSIKAFEQSDKVEDWNELMKLFLVRRTRSFIKENFSKYDKSKNRKYLEFPDGTRSYFPDRIPKALKFKTEPNDQYSRLYSDDMLEMMSELRLPRYGLNQYIDPVKAEEATNIQKQLIENLSRAGARMMGFCRSTFFKRIDSSGFSFLLTLYRHILRNCVFLYAIENGYELPIGDENSLPEDYIEDNDTNELTFDGDMTEAIPVDDKTLNIPTDLDYYLAKAAEYYQTIQHKNNLAWLPSKFFKRTFKQNLKKDCQTIIRMIEFCGIWNQSSDQKLNELESLINQTHSDEKVLVFTQFSDTANYISNQLRKRGFTNVGCATGDSANPTSLAEKFSPISNEKEIAASEQYRILVATDVLSEGQNLQDCHVIVNFDLPWAIIRLIQRAGRVDRIGQESDKIYCYSFFPADGVEKIINLRGRLNERINENANVVGSDEIFFEGNEQNLRDMFNEKSGALDDEEETEVDLSSQAYQIWKNATDADPKLKDIIPNLDNMLYSTKATKNANYEGVITYARTFNDYDILTWLDNDGNFITQSQSKILKALECGKNEPALPPLEKHHQLVAKAVNEIQPQNTSMGGILGSRFSTRYRIVQLLERYYERETNIFFSQESKDLLKLAIDDIYNYPLLESTRFILGRMLHSSGKQAEDNIVEYVLEMKRTDNLCRVEEDKNVGRDNQIICSMGLKHS